jgi:hypothetical protein
MNLPEALPEPLLSPETPLEKTLQTIDFWPKTLLGRLFFEVV